eukprot:superscaffoldBa00006788_g21888
MTTPVVESRGHGNITVSELRSASVRLQCVVAVLKQQQTQCFQSRSEQLEPKITRLGVVCSGPGPGS